MFPCHVLETAAVTCLAIPCKHTFRIFLRSNSQSSQRCDSFDPCQVTGQVSGSVRLGMQKPWPEKLSVIARFVSRWVIYGEDTPPKLFLSKGGFGLIQEEKEITKSYKKLLSLQTWHSQEELEDIFSRFNVCDGMTSLEIRFFDTFHWHACHPLHETVALRVCDTLGSLR